MPGHKRLGNLLKMIRMLMQPGGQTATGLSGMFEVSKRSIYRYIEVLKDCEFAVEKKNGRLFIKHSGNHQVFPLFSDSEVKIIQQAVGSLPAPVNEKSALLKKLHSLTDATPLAQFITQEELGKVVDDIRECIRSESMAYFKNYNSPNDNTVKTRLVEPISFSINLRYIYAFDLESGEVRQFKPERIGSVEILNKPFQHKHKHHIEEPDVFGMNGKPHAQVTLQLSRRALLLLKEEFPESHAFISDTTADKSVITFPVKGFEGVGRFALGLPGEIVVIGPDSLLTYLAEKQQTPVLGKPSPTRKKKRGGSSSSG